MSLFVAPGVILDDADMEISFARSGGPGGQNVNKVSSKVQLRFHLMTCRALRDDVKARMIAAAGSRLLDNGDLFFMSERTRDQKQNLGDAQEKLAEFIRVHLKAPTPRHKTKPTKGSKRRRLKEKSHRGDIKKGRGRVDPDD